MANIQSMRLFSIVSALMVGFWLPLKLIGFEILVSTELYLDTLVSVAAAANIYLYFVTRDLSPKKFQNWLNLSVLLDLVCMMPLLLIQDALLKDSNFSLVFLNLVAVRHVWKIKDYRDEFHNLEPIVYRLVPLAMMLPILVHLIACGWIALGSGSADVNEDQLLTYVKAFYWAMTTLTTVGYGDIVAKTMLQMIYAALTQIIGVGVFGYILSYVASLLSRLDAARENHMDNLDQIEAFMNSYHIPVDVKSKVRAYYHYIWKEHKGRMDKSLIDRLPNKLQSELNFSINKVVIERVSFLKDASRELLEDIMLALDHRVFVPCERIFRAGDPGDCLFMIHAGQVEILTANGDHIAFLNEGAVFGEVSLIEDGPRTATVLAKSYCDLYVLPKAEFNKIVEVYPDFKNHLHDVMIERKNKQTGPQLQRRVG